MVLSYTRQPGANVKSAGEEKLPNVDELDIQRTFDEIAAGHRHAWRRVRLMSELVSVQ